MAQRANVDTPQILLKVMEEYGRTPVHLSIDSVFSGMAMADFGDKRQRIR
ncbi:MAG: hypothetical protein U0894_16360 [Pirellulales bacterium]